MASDSGHPGYHSLASHETGQHAAMGGQAHFDGGSSADRQPDPDGLFHTFGSEVGSTSHWSLNNFAWDWRTNRVVSREDFAQARDARMEEQPQHGTVDEPANDFVGSGAPVPHRRPEFRVQSKNGEDFHRRPASACDSEFESSAGSGVGEELKRGVNSVHVAEDTAQARYGGTTWLESLRSSVRTVTADKDKSSRAKEKEATYRMRICPVEGCNRKCNPSSKKRIERVLCVDHVNQPQVMVNGQMMRFCQVCYVLHDHSAYRGKNKTCNAVLERKKLLRGKGVDPTGSNACHLAEASINADGGQVGNKRIRRSQMSDCFDWDQGSEGKEVGNKESSVWSAIKSSVGLLGKVANKKVQSSDLGSRRFTNSCTTLPPSTASAAGPVHSYADKQMLRDMEEGSLSSLVVPSVAIKVPYAVPEDLLNNGGMNELLHFLDFGAPVIERVQNHQTWPTGGVQNSGGLQDGGDLVVVESRWPEQAMLPGLFNKPELDLVNGEPAMHEMLQTQDFGFDGFIRPGSLIFGMHAPAAVVEPSANEKGETCARKSTLCKRRSASSMLESLANGDSVESKLVRCATRALKVSFDSNSSYWSSQGAGNTNSGSNQGDIPEVYDASGTNLVTVPEGVFGSFNGEISRLEMDSNGRFTAVKVVGLPKGFPPDLLEATSSVLDSSKKTALVHLPWMPQPGTTVVCMFGGAHLPLRINYMKRGVTEIEICLSPKGGNDVPARWALTNGANLGEMDDGADGDANLSSWSGTKDAHRKYNKELLENIKLEGLALLEVVIDNGPMRGLPVGATVPLLLTPDKDLREELLEAMSHLEAKIENERVQHTTQKAARISRRSSNRKKPLRSIDEQEECKNSDPDLSEAVLPNPKALISMLGSVLAAHNRGQEQNPRMWHGVTAMMNYFRMWHTAYRLKMDINVHRGMKGANSMLSWVTFVILLALILYPFRARLIQLLP